MCGAMFDYSHYTKDRSYDGTITAALLAQVGPNFDYMLPSHFGDEGNDDQAFWGFAVMAAAERNFPQPPSSIPSWLDLTANIWNTVVARWNTKTCGGGLTWQIFESNPNGLNYKNSVSNGGFFQISARLARATGNQTYLAWANKIWDWSTSINMVDRDFYVYDGAHQSDNCSEINQLAFSYSTGIYLYGAAVMADVTGAQVWKDRAHGLLEGAKSFFGGPSDNATNIMWEHACEGVGTCNVDMKSFKGYLSRFMYASAVMLPSLAPDVKTLLHASAEAAVKTCTGGPDRTTCGQKWYVGGFDNSVGLGQSMSALETVHGILATGVRAPLGKDDIKDVRGVPGSQTDDDPPPSEPTKRSNSAGTTGVEARWLVLSALAGAWVWAAL